MTDSTKIKAENWLMDKYAGQAMQSYLSNSKWNHLVETEQEYMAGIAGKSFLMAVQMIYIRNKLQGLNVDKTELEKKDD
jgi:hypothetical protein